MPWQVYPQSTTNELFAKPANPHKILSQFHYSDILSKPTYRQHLKKWMPRFALPPSSSSSKQNHRRNELSKFAPQPSWQGHWPSMSPSQSSFPSSPEGLLAPQSSAMVPSSHFTISPQPSSSQCSRKKKMVTPPPLPLLALPPPPPSKDCESMTCTDPQTYTPPGSPCACVLPIEIAIRLSITLYAFFPLVSELSKEIATSISLKQSQVRIMGANAVNQQLEKTIALVSLVPTEDEFNATIAFAIYDLLWKRELSIKASLFGSYEVVYVHYPGLPPSPPSMPSSNVPRDDRPFSGNHIDGSTIKPLGVDISRTRKNGTGRNMNTGVVLSFVAAFFICVGVIWLLCLKLRSRTYRHMQTSHNVGSSQVKASGSVGSLTITSKTISTSTSSFNSYILAYAGTAKIFSASGIERATDNFKVILGEGGFGLVHSGILDDGRKVAVKTLKRDDRHSRREFLAEVEMLSRLHHRNLVKLIGICTEDNYRCLVYELVPNGSLQSHLHGVNKKASPLDWHARMKIALGAAQGLAYLHEDSNPCVIHRDFKSSNILLEHDFTPKVSDFGLARTTPDDGNKHTSTHVMGTFGYVAPEYAMTGHLLVKSDVYSYGVVLLELLSGRQPVDLSQPPGQENLVAWARPLLTTMEGLQILVDPTIKSSDIPFDGVIKFAAIAAMCVQPEASHRPFMGEVVQALKFICNEFDETRKPVLGSCSQSYFYVDIGSQQTNLEAPKTNEAISVYYSALDSRLPLSVGDLESSLARLEEVPECEQCRREFYSAPLGTGAKRRFWQWPKILSKGSMTA
ncbi:unnamed protein product [Cuscuta campestris]|uniref:Protein kinase domain-containing protein n=1 Tax=Cuscuta campestris TaxID=132261 RepID=A0A484MX20_9ASTE|nr:unnamed protein product [Cuscuta campestris]